MKNFYWLILLLIFSCSGDKSNSVHKTYFEGTNQLMQSVEYKKGKKNGYFLEYYRTGNLSDKQFYVNDTITDTAFTYHENGVIESIKVYKMGAKNGVFQNFNKAGLMYKEITYADNTLDGPANKYTYKTGKPLEKLNYKNGTKQGHQEYYHNNGKLKESYNMNYDHLTDLEEWDEKGRKIDNDIHVTITEQNRLLMENKFILIVKLENPTEDDEVLEGMKDENGILVTLRKFEKVKDHFESVYQIGKGQVIIQKMFIIARRKSYFGNRMEKVVPYNFSANNY